VVVECKGESMLREIISGKRKEWRERSARSGYGFVPPQLASDHCGKWEH